MAKSQSGLYVTIKAFIETGKDLQKSHEATSAYMQGKQTGDYSNLFHLMTIDEIEAVPRTRRVVGDKIVQPEVDEGQVDIEDFDPAPSRGDADYNKLEIFDPAKVASALSRGDSVDREPVDD